MEEGEGDSEVTKEKVKKLITPKEGGLQIRSIRKVQKGGGGYGKTVIRIKEAAKEVKTLKWVEPKILWSKSTM